MVPEEAFVMLFLFSAAAITTLGVLYARARGRIQEMERTLGISSRSAINGHHLAETSGEVRVGQLENQVDHIAAQMDRLAESQDFLSRVMSEKLDRLTDGRIDTPH